MSPAKGDKRRTPMTTSRSPSPNLFVDNRPGTFGKVNELFKVLGRRLAFRRTPGVFHRFAVIPVKLDDGIPPRMLAGGIGGDVVLDVAPQARNALGHRAVNLAQVGGKVRGGQILPPV